MVNCILTSPSGDVLHIIKESGGVIVDFKEYDVLVKVPEHWIIPETEDFLDSKEESEYEDEGVYSDFMYELGEEIDTSRVTLRLLIPEVRGTDSPVLIWERHQDGVVLETYLSDSDTEE